MPSSPQRESQELLLPAEEWEGPNPPHPPQTAPHPTPDLHCHMPLFSLGVRRSNRIRTNMYILACILIMIPVLYYSVFYLIDYFYPPFDNDVEPVSPPVQCNEQCRISIVESIPQGLTFPPGAPSHASIGDSLQRLIENAQTSISIASFYWTLRGQDLPYSDNTDDVGEAIFAGLKTASTNKNIRLRIVQSQPTKDMPDDDTQLLAKYGAEVRNLSMTRYFGGGVLHTKLWLVDDRHFFLGSANLDWRSMTQVKELGVLVENCECLADDMRKLFEVYWFLAGHEGNKVPPLPANFSTSINNSTPLAVPFNDTKGLVYLSSSPPSFCPRGRQRDDYAIQDAMYHARKFIYVSVMDYFPRTLYMEHNEYWPYIDDALRRAAYNYKVHVRVMVGWWNHSMADMPVYLKSLKDLSLAHRGQVEVKMFVVPVYTESQGKIPFARVNHCKFMVTDKHAYIGTSNWSGDYFINTGGVGFILQQNRTNTTVPGDFRQQLENVFLRDWDSEYAHPLSDYINATHVL